MTELDELKELEKEELKLFDPADGGFSEFVAGDLNNINKKKLQLLVKRWGKVYVYSINKPWRDDWIVKEYDGRNKIGEFDIALPMIDDKLIAEIEQWREAKRKTLDMLDHIYNRAETLSAVFFSWA